MKINNDLVVFDLETTDDEEHRIIEIGAVLLDRELNPVDTWTHLVSPEIPVSPFVTKLTGLTNTDLNYYDGGYASLWFAVGVDWWEWATSKVSNPRRLRLAAWGNYFDINVLRREYARERINYPWSGTCFDVKTVAAMWCALSGRGTDKLGLQSVAGYMGIGPEGRWHRALTDARVTAAVLKRAMTDLAGGVWLPEKSGTHRRVEVRG